MTEISPSMIEEGSLRQGPPSTNIRILKRSVKLEQNVFIFLRIFLRYSASKILSITIGQMDNSIRCKSISQYEIDTDHHVCLSKRILPRAHRDKIIRKIHILQWLSITRIRSGINHSPRRRRIPKRRFFIPRIFPLIAAKYRDDLFQPGTIRTAGRNRGPPRFTSQPEMFSIVNAVVSTSAEKARASAFR